MTDLDTPATTTYEQAGYLIVPGLVSRDVAEFLADYWTVLHQAGRLDPDVQVPGSLQRYGAPAFDALLARIAPVLSAATGLDLLPTYSFARRYSRGQELVPHRDRPECQHSVTVHLAAPDGARWPIWMRDGTHDPVEVNLEPGDGVIYQGQRMMHWRNPLDAEWYLQVFLHYVDARGPHAARRFDGRPSLGRSAAEKVD